MAGTEHQDFDPNDPGDAVAEAPSSSSGAPLLPDPGLIWQVFRRNFVLFCIVVLAILGLTGAIMATLTPQYFASASVLIEPTSEPIRTTGPNSDPNIVGVDEVDTEIALISSPLVAKRAAELYADRFASPDGDPFTADEIEMIGMRIGGVTNVTRTGDVRVVDSPGIVVRNMTS